MAQGPGPGQIGPGPGCNLFPAPPSVGTTVNLSYFGPAPSTTNQSLVGPVQLLKTGPVDAMKGTITIPLYLGHKKDGRIVWYVLTDVDDADEAAERVAVHLHYASDHAGIGPKPSHPETVAEDHLVVAPRLSFFGKDVPSQHGAYAQSGKNASRYV